MSINNWPRRKVISSEEAIIFMTIELELNLYELNVILSSLQKSSKSLSNMSNEYKQTAVFLLKIRDKLIEQAQEQGLLTDFFAVSEQDNSNRRGLQE
jgi:hypothetical protein